MRDPLDAAVSALVTRSDRDPVDAGETRSRLMRSIARKEQGQRVRWAGGVVGALLLTNSVTWAWSTERLPQAARELATMLRVAEPDAAGSSRPSVALVDRARASRGEFHAPAPRSAARASDVMERAAVEPAPRADAPQIARRDAPARVVVPARPPIERLAVESALDTRDRETFGAAHELHFEGTDPRLALSAWDRYLAEFPAGRFVPEAQWNRALCLVRLNDREGMIAALTPFAEGAHGGVRQREARAVLEALEPR